LLRIQSETLPGDSKNYSRQKSIKESKVVVMGSSSEASKIQPSIGQPIQANNINIFS
jgi:hypothetical protein